MMVRLVAMAVLTICPATAVPAVVRDVRPPMLTAHDCGDFLRQLGGKPAHVTFLGCRFLPDRQGRPLRARYHVAGRYAAGAETYLARAVGMAPLKRVCCQWETGPSRFSSPKGTEFSIVMVSPETVVTSRTEWRHIPVFEITVESLSDEI